MSIRRLSQLQWFGFLAGGIVWFAEFLAATGESQAQCNPGSGRWNLPHEQFHRGLTAHAGERVNFVLGQMFDHAERYRRLHIGHGPTAWATADHREILDAAELPGHVEAVGRDARLGVIALQA